MQWMISFIVIHTFLEFWYKGTYSLNLMNAHPFPRRLPWETSQYERNRIRRNVLMRCKESSSTTTDEGNSDFPERMMLVIIKTGIRIYAKPMSWENSSLQRVTCRHKWIELHCGRGTLLSLLRNHQLYVSFQVRCSCVLLVKPMNYSVESRDLRVSSFSTAEIRATSRHIRFVF